MKNMSILMKIPYVLLGAEFVLLLTALVIFYSYAGATLWVGTFGVISLTYMAGVCYTLYNMIGKNTIPVFNTTYTLLGLEFVLLLTAFTIFYTYVGLNFWVVAFGVISLTYIVGVCYILYKAVWKRALFNRVVDYDGYEGDY